MTNDFQVRLNKYLHDCSADEGHAKTLDLLKAYFHNNTGGHFETYGTNDPYAISADDLVAVTMLSMEFKLRTKSGFSPQSALKVAVHAEELSGFLKSLQIAHLEDPRDLQLQDITAADAEKLLLKDGAPAQLLVQRLLSLLSDSQFSPNTKWVAVSKLVSRKRPSLLPIRDGVVAQRLGYEKNPYSEHYLADWWREWHAVLTTQTENGVRQRLEEIQTQLTQSGEFEFVPSLIRIADVLVWSRCDCDHSQALQSSLD